MASKKTTPKKTTPKRTTALDRSAIIAAYMDYVLSHEKAPTTVYAFCKDLPFEEAAVYPYFGNIAAIEKGIWEDFYTHTLKLLEKNKDFALGTGREKMLSFFFSFFELLSLNRSYVIFTLGHKKEMLDTLMSLKGLRSYFKSFAKDLMYLDNTNAATKLTQFKPAIFSEAAWVQLLLTIKFWMGDGSANFEKTDILIEKSINTVFEVLNNTPLEQVFDLGKFLFKAQRA